MIPVPYPTVRRLPQYVPILARAMEDGRDFVSSSEIGDELKLEPIQVRKDLASIGITGQPRKGFPVGTLHEAIRKFLGWDNTRDAFIVGAGNLGMALAGYEGFSEHGLNIVACFDVDPFKIGKTVSGKKVLPVNRLADLAARMHVRMGILTVPPDEAQHSAEVLVQAGMSAIWNFTPVHLVVPESVIVERVDLAASLAVISRRLAETIVGANKSQNSTMQTGNF